MDSTLMGRPRKKAAPTCPACGRSDVPPSPQYPSRRLFHYAPKCERPCVGGITVNLKREDAPDGFHLAGGTCDGCGK